MISFVRLNRKMLEFIKAVSLKIDDLKKEIKEKYSEANERRASIKQDIDNYLKEHEGIIDSDDLEFNELDDKDWNMEKIIELLDEWEDSLDSVKDTLLETPYLSDKEITEFSIENLNI